MRSFFVKLLASFLCFSVLAYAEGNSFNKIRYNGGSIPSKVDPKDWNNKLVITSNAIALFFKDKVTVSIPAKSVTALSYGQEAHRRVGTMVALAILIAPVALFGLFHKTRLHYIGIQYTTPEGEHAGILLQGDKDNYRAILVALQGVTGVSVSVAEKEREFVPVGVTTNLTKDAEGNANSATDKGVKPGEAPETVSLNTDPVGAEVYVDGEFHGNSPATLKLKPGKHTITVKMSGYKDWSREISTESGNEAHLTATLEKG